MIQKLKILVVCLLCFFSASAVFSQNTTENVSLAFNAGSAKELIRYFNKTTEVKINNEGGNYSLLEAEPVIREFFKLYPPSTFEYIHKGSSPQGLKYNIGKYNSSSKSFRVVVLLKKIDTQYVVDTLTITEEQL